MSVSSGQVFLVERFSTVAVSITLSSKGIAWNRVKDNKLLAEFDSAHLIGASKKTNEFFVWLVERSGSKDVVKKRLFRCQSAAKAQEWVDSIRCVANGVEPGVSYTLKRIYVLLNPFGGRKKAAEIFDNTVRPIFEAAAIDYELVATTHAGHAAEIGSTIDLSPYSAFVCCSGDGLLWEALQGFLSRPDWRNVVQTPFGLIPAGSGNGMAASLGCIDPAVAAAITTKVQSRPLDLVACRQIDENGEQRTWWLLLTLMWAFFADCDVLSENKRWMGDARFTMEGVHRWAANTLYDGKVAFLPAMDEKDALPLRCTTSADACQHCKLDENEDSTLTKGSSIRRKVRKKKESDSDLKEKSPKGDDNDENETLTTKKANANQSTSSSLLKFDLQLLKSGCTQGAAKDLPSIIPKEFDFKNPPKDWKVLDDDKFFLFLVVNATHIAADSFITPHSHLSDGMLDLIVSPNPSKTQALKMLLTLDGGESFRNVPYAKQFKAKAVIVEPSNKDKTGIMDADGEVIPAVMTSVQAFRGVLKILCKPWGVLA